MAVKSTAFKKFLIDKCIQCLHIYLVEYNGWLDYVRDWEKVVEENPDYPIHVMYYEDMKEV